MATFRFIKNFGYSWTCDVEADSFEEACEIVKDSEDWERDDEDWLESSCAQLLDENEDVEEDFDWCD